MRSRLACTDVALAGFVSQRPARSNGRDGYLREVPAELAAGRPIRQNCCVISSLVVRKTGGLISRKTWVNLRHIVFRFSKLPVIQ